MTQLPQGTIQTHSLLIQWHLDYYVVPLMVKYGTVDGDLVPLMVKVVPLMVNPAKMWYR